MACTSQVISFIPLSFESMGGMYKQAVVEQRGVKWQQPWYGT